MKKNGVVYRTKFPVNDRETEFEIYKGVRKGKEILYIIAFGKVENREICGVRTEQLYRKDDEKQVGQMILRCVQKMNERYKAERGYIELCARFKALHAWEKHLLCPADWKAESTRNSALAMFQGTTAPIIEELINGAQTEKDGDLARDKVLNAALKNQARRGGGEAAPDYAAAVQQANLHILRANRLYENARRRYPEWGLPPVTLKYFAFAGNAVSEEQCKELPREMMVRLAHLFWRDIEHTPLAVGGIIMLCCMTRTAETCPKFGEIRDMGDYGVYEVRQQVIGGERIGQLKTKNANRIIILPKFAMDAVRRRREILESRGCTAEEIDGGYVVSAEADLTCPANPGGLSAYIRRMLRLAGYSDAGLAAAGEELKEGIEGSPGQADIAAYVLRRNGCTYLMNCAPCPVVSSAVNVTLSGLVEALMGHKLRPEDSHCAEWIRREDNWPIIAQMLESMILDPAHSAHPASALLQNREFPIGWRIRCSGSPYRRTAAAYISAREPATD